MAQMRAYTGAFMAIETQTSALSDDALSIGHYIAVLRRRKWTLVVCTLLGVLIAAAYIKIISPTFESVARVKATAGLSIGDSSGGVDVPTEANLVSSDAVVKCASLIYSNEAFFNDPLGTELELDTLCSEEALASIPLPKKVVLDLTVGIAPQSTIITITYAAPSKLRAQAVAQAFALAYVHNRTVVAKEQLESLRAPVEAEKKEIDKEVAGFDKQIDRLLATNPEDAAASARVTGQLNNLYQQRGPVIQQQIALNSQLLNLDDSHLNPPQIVLPAQLPAKPSSPIVLLVLVIGLGAGLLLGFVMAFLRERLDDHLRGRHDLELTAGAPVLAAVRSGRRRSRDLRAGKLAVQAHPMGATSESYRTLAASISFLAATRGLKVLMVTSPTPVEGKPSTGSNLALLQAEAGRRVMLVSADMRSPSIHRFFGVANTIGLSSVLTEQAQLADAIQHPNVENLRILPGGPAPRRPTELLQSRAMADVIHALEDTADFVIIDAPPVLPVADSLGLSPLVDGALLVADAKRTTRSEVVRTREQLEQVGVRIVGAVLDNMDRRMAKSVRTVGYVSPPRAPYGVSMNGQGGTDGARERQRELETPREAL